MSNDEGRRWHPASVKHDGQAAILDGVLAMDYPVIVRVTPR